MDLTIAQPTAASATPGALAVDWTEPLLIARVDETRCIGCTRCLAACPEDAIAGAPKRMHAILSALCTGCALCPPTCPVDCIDLVPAGRARNPAWVGATRARPVGTGPQPGPAGLTDDPCGAAAPGPGPGAIAAADPVATDRDFRRRAIAAALARARSRRAGTPR